MKYAIAFLLLCTQLTVLFAQNEFTEEKSLINKIKRDDSFVYAEALDKTSKGAKELAEIELNAEIKRIYSENKKNLPEENAIKNSISQHSEYVELKRGNMTRVFVYIKKENIVLKQIEASTTPTTPIQKELKVAPVEEELPQAVESTPHADLIERKENAVEVSSVEQPAGSESVATDNPLLNEILKCTQLADLQNLLITQKEEGKLMFGKLNTMLSPASCYLIVFSSEKKVVAILDKGVESRQNLLTGQKDDNVTNYPDHGIVWFQLYK